jgi:DNA-binding NtrC family response regulator
MGSLGLIGSSVLLFFRPTKRPGRLCTFNGVGSAVRKPLRKESWSFAMTMTRRILLVDDELAILLTLKAILEMNGFAVETATSAREAKQKLCQGTFDMVISDMRMENESSGLDVIRAARSQSYNPATAILTAYPNLGGKWKTEGAESLLVKPMNTNDLLRQIEALLVTHQDSKQVTVKPEIPAGASRRGAASGAGARESRKVL